MSQTTERRKAARFPPNVPIEVELEIGKNISIGKEYLNDISLDGLSFKFNFNIESGKDININIPLDKSVFRIKARVMWSEQVEGGYKIGVRFTDSSDAFKAKIYKQLVQIEAYKYQVLEAEGRDLTFNEAAKEWIEKYAKKFS
jgi:hypothetical protein